MSPLRSGLLAAGLAAILILTAVTPAGAAPVAGKRETAARIKREMDALDAKMEIAVEDYDEAVHLNREIANSISKNEATLRRLGERTSVLQESLAGRASSMYRSGPLGPIDVLLGAASFEDFATTWDLLDHWNEQESSDVAQFKAASREAERIGADLEASRAKAKAGLKVVTERRRSIESDLARRRAMLAGVEAQIAQLLAAERSARSSRQAAYTSPARGPKGGVVAIAMQYLGRPYRWAASGPGSFDCSGFTMFVYARVGVSLPHSSRAQYSSGPQVSRADLKPGDLVFFGSPIHHVGLYVGGGQMIHSPNTGELVSIDPLLRDYVGACRP